MSWLRIDDGTDEHAKITALSAGAFRMWFAGLCYCGRRLSDGVIPMGHVPRLTVTGEWKAELAELAASQVRGKAPLWEITEEGDIQIHDYLEYNPPAAEVVAGRTASKEGMRVIRELRKRDLGDVITREQWEELPEDLAAHYAPGNNGAFVRQKGRPGRPAVNGNASITSVKLMAELNPPLPLPQPLLGKEKATPSIPRKRGRARSSSEETDLLGEEPGGTAPWAVKAKRPKGVTPRHLEATVVRILREIRQDVVKVDCCATAAGSVLSLWRAVGRPGLDSPDHPGLDAFAEELVLVARASQISTNRLFANDIRGEDKNGDRVDRTFVVSTLCAHGTWDGRLQAARQWGLKTGRLGEGGIGMALRRRWFDPYDTTTWLRLEPMETLFAGYLRCAGELFVAELGGDDLLRAQARLEALRDQPGVSGDLTDVVRLALDATGLW